MQARRVSGPPEAWLDPAGAGWRDMAAEAVALAPTPAEAQPNRYIRKLLEGRQWGVVREVSASVVHDGARLYVRLQWTDATENRAHDEADFPDAAAVILPANGDAPLATLGSREQPVTAWFWRPDIESAPEMLAGHGFGTLEKQANGGLSSRSSRDGDAWSVVLSKALSAGLAPGGRTRVAFAVWDGASGERAGISSLSPAWTDLALEG